MFTCMPERLSVCVCVWLRVCAYCNAWVAHIRDSICCCSCCLGQQYWSKNASSQKEDELSRWGQQGRVKGSLLSIEYIYIYPSRYLWADSITFASSQTIREQTQNAALCWANNAHIHREDTHRAGTHTEGTHRTHTPTLASPLSLISACSVRASLFCCILWGALALPALALWLWLCRKLRAAGRVR